MKALVADCHRNGLALIRGLHEAGVSCIAVDHFRTRPGLYSKYASERHIVPHATFEEAAFIDAIVDIGAKAYDGKKIFLFPTNDIYVMTFARNWQRLEPYFQATFETDMELLNPCIHKTEMYEVAEQAGVAYPATAYSPLEDADYENLRWPVVVKPDNKNFKHCRGLGIRKNYFCHSREELKAVNDELGGHGISFVAQQFIPGGDDELYTAGIYAYKGKLVAAFTGRKLRQFPVTLGECSHGEAVRRPQIVDYAAKFVEQAKYTGIAQVEFKHHDGEHYLMEINPRSWSWHGLCSACGVNLGAIAVNTVTTGNTDFVPQTDYSAKWNYLIPDVEHNVFRNRNISPFTALKDAFTADSHAFWDSRDPLPAFVYMGGAALKYAIMFAKSVRSKLFAWVKK